MAYYLDWDLSDSLETSTDQSTLSAESSEPNEPSSTSISEHEFSCHCCYDILVNPTTLTCGHNFCRHCLALWWESSRKNECPECREKWAGFPKINILLRDATDKLFGHVVKQRKKEIKADFRICQSLLAFQRYGDNLGRSKTNQHKGVGCFVTGVLTALTSVAVVVLVYHWSSGVVEQHDLPSKSVSDWTLEEVVSWLEDLGPWAQLYRETFLQENVNGKLLLMLGNEELLKPPYSITNQAHRKAILAELERAKTLGFKPPQDLWEYKAANAGKSLFLLYALKRSPRLTIFYLYLFDYSETFLPLIHTCCPVIAHNHSEDGFLQSEMKPNMAQWMAFLVKCCLLPYLLFGEFAWKWLAVHSWTSCCIIVNAVLLSILELNSLWKLRTAATMRTLADRMWDHLWKMLTQGLAFVAFWPFVPQFVCNCVFYWALYFSPLINVDLVLNMLLHNET